MIVLLGGCLGVVLVAVIALVVADARGKRRAQEALAARGNVLARWTVYYDVKANRIGLSGLEEKDLLRYLLFRVHDLFDYNQGMEAERRRIADAITAAARGLEGEQWSLLCPVPESECYHSVNSPQGTLFKFFDGNLYEHAIDAPRFIGGDSIAKQKGLLGECIALVQHLGNDPARGVNIREGVVRMVEKELRDGPPGPGAMFWNLPNQTLREIP